jgi:hypothetical protein
MELLEFVGDAGVTLFGSKRSLPCLALKVLALCGTFSAVFIHNKTNPIFQLNFTLLLSTKLPLVCNGDLSIESIPAGRRQPLPASHPPAK